MAKSVVHSGEDGKKNKTAFQNPFAAPEEDSNPQCGMCGWMPAWLQLFNNMKTFMFCYVALGIFQGMTGSYGGSVLPSIERRFGFSSLQFATVKAMNDVSFMLVALFVGHYGGSGHRPRWISAGMLLVGLALLLSASTEVMFPVKSITSAASATSPSPLLSEDFCVPHQNASNGSQTCSVAEKNEDSNTNPLIVFGVADFIMGLGASTPMILGLPFVDDNVSYKDTPFFFTLSFAGRLFGPIIGYGLGSIFSTIYFDLSISPPFESTDPRWISAWYLGYIICGLGVCLFAITIGCFPAIMPRRKSMTQTTTFEEEKKQPPTTETGALNHHGKPKVKPVNLMDLPKNLKRLLTNSTYMIKLGSQLLEVIAVAGYMGFSQKFIQNQYQIAPSVASIVGGVPPVFAGFLGTIIGSFLIKRFKFRPRHVSLMTMVAAIIASVCYFSVVGMGCNTPVVIGQGLVTQTSASEKTEFVDDTCDARNDCNCHSRQFSPVCDLSTNITYVSPCFAGCTSAVHTNRTKHYLDCVCAANVTSFVDNSKFPLPAKLSSVVSGLCPSTCNTFIPYIVVMCIANLCMGIPLAGVVMIQFRVVDYDLKSLANAISSLVMAALAFLPAPIIAGYIIDSTCRFWQKSVCGTTGACLLYDVDDFRVKLHVSVGVCKVLAACLDALVTYKLWNVAFDRDEVPQADSKSDHEITLQILPNCQPASLNWSDSSPGSPETNLSQQPSWEKRGTDTFSGHGSSSSSAPVAHLGLQLRKSYPADL